MISLQKRPAKKKDYNSNYTICHLATSMNHKLPRMSLTILFNLLLLSQLTFCSPLLGDNVKRNADSLPDTTTTSSSSLVSELPNSSTSTPLDANSNSSTSAPLDANSNISTTTTTTTPTSVQPETSTATKGPNELDISTSSSSTEDSEDPTEPSTQQPDTLASNVSTSPQDTNSGSTSSNIIHSTDISTTATPSSESPSSTSAKTEESSTTEKIAPNETTTPIPAVAIEPTSSSSTQTPSSVSNPTETPTAYMSIQNSEVKVSESEKAAEQQPSPTVSSNDVTVGSVNSDMVVISTTLTPPVPSGSSISTQQPVDVTQTTTAVSPIVTPDISGSAPIPAPELSDSNRTSRVYLPENDPSQQPSMQLQSQSTTIVPMPGAPTTTAIKSVSTTIRPLISTPVPSLKFTLTTGRYWRFTISPSTLQAINNKDLLRLYKNETSLKNIDEENDWITYNHTLSQLSAWPSLSKNIGSHDFVLAAANDKGDPPKPELIIKVTVAEPEKPLVLNHEFVLSHLKRQKNQYTTTLHQLTNTLSKIVATDNSSSMNKSVSMRLSDILLHKWTLSPSGDSNELAIVWSNITLHQQQDCPVEMLQTSLKRFTEINNMKQRDNGSSYLITLNSLTKQIFEDDNPQLELNLLGSCQSVVLIPSLGTQVTDSSLPPRINDQPVNEEPIIPRRNIGLHNEAPPSTLPTRTDIENTLKNNNTDTISPSSIDSPNNSPSDNDNTSTSVTPLTDAPKGTSNSTKAQVSTVSEAGTHDGHFIKLIEETKDYLGPVAVTALIIVCILLFLCVGITYIVTCIKRKNSQKFRVRNRFDFRYESERRAFLKKGSKPVILESDQRNISIGGTPQHHAKAMGDTINNPRRLGTVNTPINDSELSTPLRNLGPPTIDERNQDLENSIATSDLCKTSFSNNRYS